MTTVLVTGATDGLGRSAAAELARQVASVLVHARSRERGERAVAEIRAETGMSVSGSTSPIWLTFAR